MKNIEWLITEFSERMIRFKMSNLTKNHVMFKVTVLDDEEVFKWNIHKALIDQSDETIDIVRAILKSYL